MFFIKASIFLLLLQQLVLCSRLPGFDHHHHSRRSLLTDKAALLAFKTTIISDPNATLANWEQTVDVCNFTGVTCNKQRHRVVELNLTNCRLLGQLSHILSNLTGLRYLVLSNNHFYGTIPPELSKLRNLHFLQLDGNNLRGRIPESFAQFPNLTLLFLLENYLTGTLPASFFANCTSLANIDISYNFFTGKIPGEIGNSPGLWNLNLYNNQFTGQVPESLINTSMYSLDLEYNHLSGELPSDIVAKLPSLQNLHLSYNNMVSHDRNTDLNPFFSALGNCTDLDEIELAGMGLGGALPSSIGRLNLSQLLLQENHITGSIPRNIANVSSLMTLNLTSNLLNGTIPEEISLLSKLEQLFLSHNLFSGEIPAVLGQLTHVGLLDLSHNKFSSKIPASLGNLVRVNSLFLNNNFLSGSIPSTLGQCYDLYRLDLSHNRLTGSIPPEISGIREIRIFLNLSHNELEGPLPIELSKLENVQEIDLSSNRFTGNIFLQISSCIALRMINLSHNSLQGHLPDSLGDLKNLESFDVSGNQLSGKIPISLNKIHTLNFINLSFNEFQGMIPSGGIFDTVTNKSFLGNHHLCGEDSGIPICSHKRQLFRSRIIFILVICISVFLSAICCVIGIRRIRVMFPSTKSEAIRNPRTPELMHNFPRISYRELAEATGGFDGQRLVGTGSFGRVYKGVLSDGTAIAVKVLQFQSSNSTKSFNRECQVLKRIRHRNLIRIITACSLPDFKALVLPYMANGSLDSRLYPHSGTGIRSGSSDLSLLQRVNICSDIAEGMAYLHHHSPVKVIHCDLKPSNVLLNDDMTALVSDFGIARLVSTVGVVDNLGNSTANLLCGSIGYIAPEYGFGSTTSTKGDVYSFGVLVLEMVTRKRPTDGMFGVGISLHKWVRNHYHGRIEKVIDSSLMRSLREQSTEVKRMWDVAIGELMELGILCTQESPSTRPTMLDCADDLDRLKRYLGGDTTATFASSLGISSSTLDDD
ncbi:hypothetical protein Ddye_011620 [Dipteronia dyeriana]|uniref:non-specific serine/threonine protein kinase n=1 Tax=Dipteronia dyeriana TaxID=168575 RepID=A0AAD9X2V7_9ROSI|nr:hypothetical protein Ddye_011620 [Dipteronia dyeriana]